MRSLFFHKSGHPTRAMENLLEVTKLSSLDEVKAAIADGTLPRDRVRKVRGAGPKFLGELFGREDSTLPRRRFTHDCSRCIFLGRITINDRSGDVYICPKLGLDPYWDDIIVRFSGEGRDYCCTHPCHFSPLDPFAAAAVAMWSAHHGHDGWNRDEGTLFKDGAPALSLWPREK